MNSVIENKVFRYLDLKTIYNTKTNSSLFYEDNFFIVEVFYGGMCYVYPYIIEELVTFFNISNTEACDVVVLYLNKKFGENITNFSECNDWVY